MCKMKSNNKVRNHSAVRRELSKYEWQELNLEAYIDRAGWTKISFARSNTSCQPTLLLKNIVFAGGKKIVADHLWVKQAVINKIDEISSKLSSGAKIRFRATVYPYYADASTFRHIRNVNYSLKDIYVEAIA